MTAKTAVTSADEVLKQIESAAGKEFLPKEVRRAKVRHVLEVGTLIGYPAVLMGKEMDEDGEIVTIEIHGGEAEIAGENVAKANISPKVKIIKGNALEVIPTLQGSFDFAFIDAEKTEYLQYLQIAEDKLHSGSVVFADQMSDYLDYVRNSDKYQSRYIQVGDDGVEIAIKL